jgi:general secretion pathway protein D
LVNVGPGDLLSRESQVVHREDGAGGVNIVTSLPPGAAGVSGAGVVCVLSFQAKAPGETIVSMKSAAAVNSAQQQIKAQGGQINIVVK